MMNKTVGASENDPAEGPNKYDVLAFALIMRT